MNPVEPLLAVHSVSKRFGPVLALDDVSLQVFAGEVHAVLGENGAGKSTLMGVIAGFVTPDSGSVSLAGEPAPLGDAISLRRRGVGMVHQHFMLVPAFRVEENLALASVSSLSGGLDVQSASAGARAKAVDLGWNIVAKSLTREMPVGTQQRVEILKALAGDSKVLILDEPTAVLAPDEVADLMGVLQKLRDSGVAIVLIAHKLSEVVGIADRVTVLRQGKFVATSLMRDTTSERLAEWMIGERAGSGGVGLGKPTAAETLLNVVDLSVRGDRGEPAVRGVSFRVRAGEVFGIGGVDGNGQVELAEAVVGIRRSSSGSIKRLGAVGYIPQDRQTDGLALTMTVQDNLLIGALEDRGLRAGPFLRLGKVERWARELVEKFSIKTPSVKLLAGSLSGGNQQKVVVARALSQDPKIIVAANPTRGLDIKATAFVHGSIREAASKGAAVLLISTDHDELEILAHSVTYLSRGQFSDTLLGSAP